MWYFELPEFIKFFMRQPVIFNVVVFYSPIAAWWLLALIQNRKSEAAFSRIAIGGGVLLAFLILATTFGVSALAWLNDPR